MSNVVKVTKRDYFNALRAMVENMDAVGEYSADEVLEFIDKQVAQLDAKSEKAKAKAAEKKAEGDAISKKVAEVLTSEFQTADEIVSALNDEELTKAKVIARLTGLVNNGVAVKEQLKDVKRMGYKLA